MPSYPDSVRLKKCVLRHVLIDVNRSLTNKSLFSLLSMQASSGVPPQKTIIEEKLPVEKAFKHSALHVVSSLK